MQKEAGGKIIPYNIEVGKSLPSFLQFSRVNLLVYNVAGLCSYDLFGEINFEEWFSSGLLEELQNKSPK